MLERKWDGAFAKLADWRVWKRQKRACTRLVVRCTSSPGGYLLVYGDEDDDTAFVLCLIHEAPVFTFAGWMFGAEAKRAMYFSPTETSAKAGYLVPQEDLRPVAELGKDTYAATSGHRRDPAPDFGGKGRFPQRRYADDGSHPKTYGNLITSAWALPCCRCQAVIPVGSLVGGSLVTGTIHGDPAECRRQRRSA